MQNKTLLGGLLIVAVIALLGLHFPTQSGFAGAAPTGSTFGTQKQASIVFVPATDSATTTSILNTDSTDRMVTFVQTACGSVGTSKTPLTGAGLTSLTLKAATTSTVNPAVVSNTNFAENIVIATSSIDFVNASSSVAAGGVIPVGARWASGSYLTFFTNATNTAVCTVGVQYVNN